MPPLIDVLQFFVNLKHELIGLHVEVPVELRGFGAHL